MGKSLDRDTLLEAFDEIGKAARQADVTLHIAVYGGSALMLASNFRFNSEDVDIAELEHPWPNWLQDVVRGIGEARGWSGDWLNEAVSVHLSPLATVERDHVFFGSFPRSDVEPGLMIYVPSAEYLLALKLKAIRVLDPTRGAQEAADIRNLMKVTGATSAEAAISVMGRYFPRSADDPAKQLFLLRHVLAGEGDEDAPAYPL
jgi:hypothetical protein